MKCGTSSLHYYLGQHDQIQMSDPKELNFLTWQKRNSTRGRDWYESHFDSRYPIRGETSPGYTFFPYAQGAPELAAELVPDARIIYLVRDPIARLLSHYVHRVSAGWERRSFDEVLPTLTSEPEDAEATSLPGPPGYLVRSLYSLQLEQWRGHFPDSKILVVDNSRLLRDRANALAEIARFLGIRDCFPADGISTKINPSDEKVRPSRFGWWARRLGRATGARRLLPASSRAALIRSGTFNRTLDPPEPTDAQREYLSALLRQDVQRLRSFTGASFADWSV